MTTLRLSLQRNSTLLYALDADAVRIGGVQHHASHAAILRIGEEAWWLADDVGTAQHAARASIARRLLAHATQPRSYSLRADGGEIVLARARRRWRWSARENGLDCEIGDASYRVRSLGAFGGKFALEDACGRALGELKIGSLGRTAQAAELPLPVPESAFLLYATHRMFGYDTNGGGDGGE